MQLMESKPFFCSQDYYSFNKLYRELNGVNLLSQQEVETN